MNKVALCVPFGAKEAVTTSTGFGPGQLTNAYGLKEIAAAIRNNVPKDQVATLNEKAIPDSIGHITYIRQHTVNCDGPLVDRNAFNAWLGVMAVVGLSIRKGYRITLRPMDFNVNKARTPISSAYGECLEQIGLLNPHHPMASQLYSVCKDGEPIAILDPELMLCPYTYIPASVMRDVPWYVPEDPATRTPAGWNDLMGNNLLDEDERSALMHWLDTIFATAHGVAPVYPVRLLTAYNMARDILSHAVGNNTVTAATCKFWDYKFIGSDPERNVPVNRFPFAQVLFQVPDFGITIPTEIFTSVLVLVQGALLGDTRGSLDTRPLTVQLEILSQKYTYGAMLPLCETFTNFLRGEEYVSVDSITLTSDEFDKNGTILATMVLDVAGSKKKCTHTYSGKDQIFCLNEFYTTTMWPNFCADGVWKDYYVTLADLEMDSSYSSIARDYRNAESAPMTQLPLDSGLRLWKDGQKFSAVDITAEKSLTRAEEANGYKRTMHCQHAHYTEFPEYVAFAVIRGGQAVEAGCIYLKKPSSISMLAGNPISFSIDFGTSNTICMASVNSAAPIPVDLHSKADVRSLASFYTKLGQEGEAPCGQLVQEAENFGNYYWLSSQQDLHSRVRTMVQLYNAPEEQYVPVSGRVLPSNDNVVAYYLKNRTVDQNVYSNIKLQDMAGKNKQATERFLQHIELQCMLFAVKQRASEVKFFFSYPDALCWQNMNNLWAESLRQLKNCHILPVSLPASINEATYDEAAAASVYVNSLKGCPSPEVGYSIVDIGGGTTDISIWRQTLQKEIGLTDFIPGSVDDILYSDPGPDAADSTPSVDDPSLTLLQKGSIRYAGNFILADALYVVRKNSTINTFRTLWNQERLNASKQNMNNYVTLADELASIEVDKPTDTQAKCNERAARKSMIVNTLIDSFGFDSGINWDAVTPGSVQELLRTILRVKIAGVFYVVANYIRAVNGIDFAASEYAQYSIFLAGGGARILNLCGRDFCARHLPVLLAYNAVEENPDSTNVRKWFRRIDIQMPTQSDKIEVAEGMLLGGDAMADGGTAHRRASEDLPAYSSASTDMERKVSDAYTRLVGLFAEKLDPKTRLYSNYGYRRPSDNEAKSIYTLLELNDKNQNELCQIFTNTLRSVSAMSLPQAIVPAVTAILSVNTYINQKL